MSPNLPLTIYTILSSYCLAGCLIEHFAVFPGWLLVSPTYIGVVQIRQGYGSLMIYVVPKSILIIFLIYIWASTTNNRAGSSFVSLLQSRYDDDFLDLVVCGTDPFAAQDPRGKGQRSCPNVD